MTKAKERRRFGRLLERGWGEWIAESFGALIRLAARGIRSFFD